MDWNLVFVMVCIHALMFLTPGPDSIIVVSRATAQGLKHALATILGIVSAGIVLVPAIAFGLDIVNTISPAIWMAVRGAGALYLIYIGYRMLRAELNRRQLSALNERASPAAKTEPLFAAYIQGLLTNLGNPKMIVLLTSFLPQFVTEGFGNISFQILVLGFFMYLNGFICFIVLALTAILAKRQINSRFSSVNLSFIGGSVAGTTMLAVGVWMIVAPVKFLFTNRAS